MGSCRPTELLELHPGAVDCGRKRDQDRDLRATRRECEAGDGNDDRTTAAKGISSPASGARPASTARGEPGRVVWPVDHEPRHELRPDEDDSRPDLEKRQQTPIAPTDRFAGSPLLAVPLSIVDPSPELTSTAAQLTRGRCY